MLASAGFKNGASGNQHFWKDRSPSKQHCGEGERGEGGKVLTKTTESKRAGTPTEVTRAMVNMQMKTTFFKNISTLIPPEKLPYADKLVNDYPCWVNFQISARRLKHFVKKFELQTEDLNILEIVKRYQISFLSQSLQQQLPREIHLNLKKICSGGGK